MRILTLCTALTLLPALALAAPDSGPTPAATSVSDSGPQGGGTGPILKPDPKEPKTLDEAVGMGKEAITAAKLGHWWYFASLVCLIIMFLLKFIGSKMGWWVKLGRWRYVILPVLALAAALLAAFHGGVSVGAAVGVFGTSWAAGMLEELWNHGILGKPHGS